MDKNRNRECLDTIKEMVLDERKLVTYISISKEMCLHVNESKSLLSQLVEDLKKSISADVQLNINYIISGLLEGNSAQTIVCNESDIDALKNKFKTVFYQHFYSVSVGKPSADNVSFMALNKFEDFPLCTGLIKSNLCVKRSSAEIGSLKTSSQETYNIDQKPNNLVSKKVKENIKMTNGASESKQVKVPETKSEPVIKTAEVPTPKKEQKSNGLSKPESKNLKSQKGIAGFFNKPGSASAKSSTKNVKSNISKNIVKQEKQIEEPEVKIEKMDVDEDINKKVNKTAKTEKETANNGNRSLDQIKKTAKVDKKRKRVLHVSDSESDEEKNDPFSEEPLLDHESEDEIPPTPIVNTVKITSGLINPKKRRKIVDKTYTDEDGYILTKKEEVYESCSENEEEINVKENIQKVNNVKMEVSPPEKKIKTEISPPEKKNGKNNKKKMASPQKGKQATLMSFFKKV